MTWQIVSTSSDATVRLGELFGKNIRLPALIELRSDLGGGKTTFTRGLARGFGSSDVVASPTFTLSKIYTNNKHQQIHHFDFYRLSEPGVVADQLAESLENQKVLTVVEWSDVVKNVLPKDRLSIEIKPLAASEDERQIVVTYSESQTQLLRAIETEWAQGRP